MTVSSLTYSKLASICAVGIALMAAPSAEAAFLVGNTLGDSVSRYDETTGAYLGDFIAAGSGGLQSPDALTYGPDGNLYVSSGTDTSGQILRYDGKSGAYLGVFAQGGGLARPYGTAFGPDGNLYVASFRSDEILRYNGQTGAFIDVFAKGNGTAGGLLNGPNDLLFGPGGALYVTTEGSVADGMGGVTFAYDSQVLRYDLATGVGQVFAGQPAATPNGNGYVSLLGLVTGPDGLIYTSDYAGGIRSYNASGTLVQTIDTGALFGGSVATSFGDFAFGADGALYASAFNDDGSGVSANGIARCVIASGSCSVFVSDSTHLNRPIGFAITPVPEPGTMALLALGLLAGSVVIGPRRGAAARRPRHMASI